MRNDKRNLIVDLTLGFSLKIISYCELLEEKGKKVIGHQLLKSGTSIGANVWEAQNAESRKDFIHKLKIAAKEADETEYWLHLCKHSTNYPIDETLIPDLNSIVKVLSKIIASSKKSRKSI